jgi:AbiV family abortive infection protein
MRIKAVRDLIQKSDSELFAELEQGLRLCHENAERTMSDVAVIAAQKRHRAATILQNVANEEAAKALILLDVVRCPRAATDERTRLFKYFINHLPKGIYASVCDIRPCSFAEVRQWVDRERKEFYLDGPTGTDWIYANTITTSREQAMYVDYVYAEGNYWWHDPGRYDTDLYSGWGFPPSSVVRLTTALRTAGFFSMAALTVIAEIWRSVTINDSLSIHDLRKLNGVTIEKLNEKELLTTTDQKALGLIFHEWIFPLYPLDLFVDENKAEVEAERGSSYEY